MIRWLLLITGLMLAPDVLAQQGAGGIPGIPAVTVTPGEQGEEYSVTLQILAFMTALTFLPAMLMMMTSNHQLILFVILSSHLN